MIRSPCAHLHPLPDLSLLSSRMSSRSYVFRTFKCGSFRPVPSSSSAPDGWIPSVSQVSVFTSPFLEEPSFPPRLKQVPVLFFFLAALGLHCCAQALCSCGRWESLSSCGAGASHCHGLSSCGAWALGCRASRPTASEIFPDQGLNWCPLHWQADS